MNEGAFQRPIQDHARPDVSSIVWGIIALLLTLSPTAKSAAEPFPRPADSIASRTAVPISQVRRDANENYVPDRVGDTVTVRGRTSMQQGIHMNGRLVFVQDETGGIAVQLPDDSTVQRGDSLRVHGIVQHRNGLTRLHALNYTCVDAPPRPPTPAPLTVSTAHADTYEGQLVRIRGRVTARRSNEGGKYLLIEGTSENASDRLAVFVLHRRIDEISLDQYGRGDEITVTGVLSQYDYSPPYDEYYQVLPRDPTDLSRVGLMSAHYQTIIILIIAGALLAIIAVFTLRAAVRRRTQQLVESRTRFRRLAEATFEGIIIHEDGEILDVNRALIEMIGYERDELVGRAFSDVLSTSMHANASERAADPSGPGSADTYEGVMVRKDGSSFPAEIEEKVVEVPDQCVRVAAIRNVTERKKWETEILNAKEKAEQMSRLKSSLLNNMSHELRTPITSIIGYAELIINDPEADHAAFASRIRQSGKRLSRTLQSVLEMAQIESGTLEVEPRDVEVGTLVREVVDEHRPMASRADLSLEVEETLSEDPLYTDRTLMYRVLSNLVHNAIKFTETGTIQIDVEPAESGVRIAVSDPGIGIDPAFRQHLFEPFKQESEGRARTHEGTGLGLALTKRMVTLLGGSIEVTSAKGEGSTFAVEVPPVSTATETETALTEAASVKAETT